MTNNQKLVDKMSGSKKFGRQKRLVKNDILPSWQNAIST
jgi:hypothetical protein